MSEGTRVISALPDSFHDCPLSGLRWVPERFEFVIDLVYIVEWIHPRSFEEGYRFLVSKSVLTFENVDDVCVSLEWKGTLLNAAIDSMRVLDARQTPLGPAQRKYEVTLADPVGGLSLWATGYSLALLHEPVVVKVPDDVLRRVEDRNSPLPGPA